SGGPRRQSATHIVARQHTRFFASAKRRRPVCRRVAPTVRLLTKAMREIAVADHQMIATCDPNSEAPCPPLGSIGPGGEYAYESRSWNRRQSSRAGGGG